MSDERDAPTAEDVEQAAAFVKACLSASLARKEDCLILTEQASHLSVATMLTDAAWRIRSCRLRRENFPQFETLATAQEKEESR